MSDSVRTILTAIILVVLETELRTEVGYLPHWLFVITMLLGVAAFIVLNFEQPLGRYIPRGYGLIRAVICATFVGSLIFSVLYGSEYGAKPFRSEVRTNLNSSPIGRGLTMFVGTCGPTVSSISFLVNIQIANLENVPNHVEEYSVEVSRHQYLPWAWYQIPIIPLPDCSLYAIGPYGAPKSFIPQIKGMKFPKGTYLLATPQPRRALSSAMAIKPDRLLDDEFERSIPNHETIRGWVALGATYNFKTFTGQKLFFRVTVRDSAGRYTTTVERTPICGADVQDTSVAALDVIGHVQDLSGLPFKSFGK